MIAIVIIGMIGSSWFWYRICPILGCTGLWPPPLSGGLTGGITYALFLISAAAVIGVAVDAFSDIAVEAAIKLTTKKGCIGRVLAIAFLKCRIQRAYLVWEQHFLEAIKASPYRSLPLLSFHLEGRTPCPESSGRIAAGIFLKEANKENFDWMNYHYSMYGLTRNLSVCVFAVALSEIAFFNTPAHIVAFGFAVSYLLLCHAVDSYLYSYVLAFRQSTLVCLKPINEKKN